MKHQFTTISTLTLWTVENDMPAIEALDFLKQEDEEILITPQQLERIKTVFVERIDELIKNHAKGIILPKGKRI